MRENRKTRVGRVVSNKMEKTVVVLIEERRQHPLYRRTIRRSERWKAHNEGNNARLGDLVRIEECRPLSKEKHWRVIEIVERGEVAEVQPQAIGAEIEAATAEE